MLTLTQAGRLPVLALFTALTACGTAEPVVYTGITSSSYLAPNTHDESGRVPYRYSTGADWQAYTEVIVDPVAVYRGPDQQFGTMPENEKTELAQYMEERFTEALHQRFRAATGPGPGALRVTLTLTGATANTPVVSTMSRFDMAGGLYNGVQAVRGGEGTLTGAVIYSVELHDAVTGQLLAAYVSKQYPNPYNIPASIGSLSAAKAGIDKGAEALLAELR